MKHPPRLPEALDEQPLTDADLEAGARVRERRLRNPQLAGADLHGIDFVGVELAGGDLSGVRLENGGLQDGVVERTNLANLRAVSSTLLRVRLRGCRMTGLQWAEGLWRDVEVSDCRADLLALRRTQLERVTFRDCVLSEADLLEARLREVTLERCTLAGADLRGTRFERCVLRGCALDGVHGIGRLDGITMPWPDIVDAAGTFASALGVRVAED
jgi:uncharacterized protein YjbI with pentapeptide repeats